MPKEIEKKYLIRENGREYAEEGLFRLYPTIELLAKSVLAQGRPIRQGYMPIGKGMDLAHELRLDVAFRVEEARLREASGNFYLTLKSAGNVSRDEIEHEITKLLFDKHWSCTKGRRVEKVRLELPYDKHTLEIDVYTDRDLITAELEISTINEAEELQPVGLDVTTDSIYKNKNLAK